MLPVLGAVQRRWSRRVERGGCDGWLVHSGGSYYLLLRTLSQTASAYSAGHGDNMPPETNDLGGGGLEDLEDIRSRNVLDF